MVFSKLRYLAYFVAQYFSGIVLIGFFVSLIERIFTFLLGFFFWGNVVLSLALLAGTVISAVILRRPKIWLLVLECVGTLGFMIFGLMSMIDLFMANSEVFGPEIMEEFEKFDLMTAMLKITFWGAFIWGVRILIIWKWCEHGRTEPKSNF